MSLTRASLVLVVDSSLDSLRLIGPVLHSFARHCGFGEQDCHHVELCAVEAVTNSIRHAYSDEGGHAVRVYATLASEGLVLEVADDGKPMVVEEDSAGRADFDPADVDTVSESGRGLFLMSSLMDEIELLPHNEGNRVRLEKRLQR